MKKAIIVSLFLISVMTSTSFSQLHKSVEVYGNTLNLGIGLGYYGYAERSMPVFHGNFEFDVAKSFTLAPFISFYSYRNRYYKGNPHDNNRYYYYETVIPLGVKGTYYFDDLLDANKSWDFYAAASLGFAIINSHWDGDYGDHKDRYRGANPLFLALHIGSEYHLNDRLGLFLDLSTGVSTFGLAIHFTN